MKSAKLIILSLTICCGSSVTAFAVGVPFAPGNTVVFTNDYSSSSVLLEYTRDGDLVRSVGLQNDGSGNRDVSIGADGKAYLYNGVFSPKLSVYDPFSATFEHFTIPGWSTTNGYQGGVANVGKYTFLTDMNTANGAPSGFIRFDNVDRTFLRISTADIGDVTIGLDGRVYTLSAHDDRRVRSYDPTTLQLLSDVLLETLEGSIAVDQSGNVYCGRRGSSGKIDKFSPTGALLQTLSVPTFAGLTDVEFSSDGSELMFVAQGGKVGFTDRELTGVTGQFTVPGDLRNTFAALVPVPEPASAVLILCGAVSFCARGRYSYVNRNRLPHA